MFGILSIRSKLLVLLAVPVAGSVLLGVAGVAGAWGDRARAGQERRAAVVAGQAVTAVHELQEERVRAAAWVAGDGRTGRASSGPGGGGWTAPWPTTGPALPGSAPPAAPRSTRPSPWPPSALTGWPWSGSRSTGGWSPPRGPDRKSTRLNSSH